jgi:hypothetical protein
MGLQSCESPTFGNFGTPNLGVLGQNDIWVLAPWPNIENIIRGKVVASPKSTLSWVLWVHVCLWLVCAPKVLIYALTNLLFGLCGSVWIIEPLVIHPNPIPYLQHTPLPPKCYKPRSAPQLLLLPSSSPLDSYLSPSKSLGVCHSGHISFWYKR